MTTNYDFYIKTDVGRYKGEWIAIANEKVVSQGRDAEMAYETAMKKVAGKKISLAKIPEEQLLAL